MADAWNDYRHLFGAFADDNALRQSAALLPQKLDREFEFRLLVSNVGVVKLSVPPRRRSALAGMSDRCVLEALSCFMSPSYMVQMEGSDDGWIFRASPFHPGLPQVRVQTDRAYRLMACEMGEEGKTDLAFVANWRQPHGAEAEVH